MKVATAEDVRTWGRKRGFEVREHGRLDGALIDAFNKAHKAVSYQPTMHQPSRVVKLSGQRVTGNRKVNVKVATTFPEVRDWATANGFKVGVRGRLSRSVLDAYATAKAS